MLQYEIICKLLDYEKITGQLHLQLVHLCAVKSLNLYHLFSFK